MLNFAVYRTGATEVAGFIAQTKVVVSTPNVLYNLLKPCSVAFKRRLKIYYFCLEYTVETRELVRNV